MGTVPPKGRLGPYALSAQAATAFSHKAILWWLPFLYLLISDAFYLRTYDSAQVKISLVQMGGVCLLGLWLCRLLDAGKSVFSKTDLACLAPFLAYFAYGIFSYLHAPYQISSLDFFLRRIFYMTVALIVVREFHENAINRFTRILIWAAWLTVGYGFLQYIDLANFPRGPGTTGPDPFIWRGAFGDRVFSTFGNPNFFGNFLVIIFPILVCQFLKTKEEGFSPRLSRGWALLPLIFMTLWDLYWTQTKGAWIGFSISTILLVGTYMWFFNREALRRAWMWLSAVGLVFTLVVGLAVANKLRQSFTSVNFRLFTWEATWEMIMTQPVVGTGLGSFWVIYPAFRRPPIFHIEGKHNTETDHAEDEYLEVLFDEGIAGFGIFIWLLFSTFVIAYGALGQMLGSLKEGQRAPPRAYDLLGYLIAFQGMMAHNFFDVSLRFVSSGIYFGLLPGLVVNLARGRGLYELHPAAEPAPQAGEEGRGWETAAAFLIWPLRLLCWAALAYMANKLLVEFTELQGPLIRLKMQGEVLQWWIAWGAFLFCVAAQLFIFARTAFLTRNPVVPTVIMVMLLPLNKSWGFFRADVYHNIAIFFSKNQDWENAVKHYLKVGALNPAFVMANYFKGNVFNDRFNMAKVYNPNWGDAKDTPRDDFERASDAYAEVRAAAPNYVQMHHQMGVLHLKKADWEFNQGRPDAGNHHLDEALKYFQLYRNIDPVFGPNYLRMGQVYMIRKQYDKAAEIYRAMIEADECAVAPSLLEKPSVRKTLLAYQQYVETEKGWRHLHETTEGYTNWGNASFLAEDLLTSEKAYRRAVQLDPKNENALRNLQATYGKAQSLGRLKLIQSPQGGQQIPQILPAR